MTSRIQLGIFLLFFVGCQDQGVAPPVWLAPYERWQSFGLQDYTIDQTRWCYCAGGGQTVRLVIRSRVITSVTSLSDSLHASLPPSTMYLTVDSMFILIRNPGSDSLVVSYNPEYGYPERLDINPQMHPVDGGVVYQTSDLQIP